MCEYAKEMSGNIDLFGSGKLRIKEKRFSNSNNRKTSMNGGSFSPILASTVVDPFSDLFTSSPFLTEEYPMEELCFFSKAAVNPAAQTYQRFLK